MSNNKAKTFSEELCCTCGWEKISFPVLEYLASKRDQFISNIVIEYNCPICTKLHKCSLDAKYTREVAPIKSDEKNKYPISAKQKLDLAIKELEERMFKEAFDIRKEKLAKSWWRKLWHLKMPSDDQIMKQIKSETFWW